jgi:PAS domain S-box-containing protein
MTALAESATTINASLHLPDVLQGILEQISQALRVEAVSLALIDSENNELEYLASTSNEKHSVVGEKIRMGQGVAGWVAENQQGAVVPNAYEDPRFYPEIDKTTGFETKAIACAPIQSRGEVIGILEAINPLSGGFDPDALSVLTGIGSLAGTAIRHAQLFEDLQAAHKRYHDLFDGSLNSMIITNLDGIIVEANQQTAILSKYEKDKLLDLPIDAIHKPDFDILGQGFSLVSGDRALSYESVLHTKADTEIPIMVHVHPVSIEGRSFLQWVFQDFTERKELDQLRDDLLSMIYHDLRSPLANVVSSLDIMKTTISMEEDPAVKSLIDIAVRSTDRIERLTNSMLDINLLEAGRPVVNKKPIPTLELIQDSLEIIKPVAENKRQEIILHVPDDIPQVLVNDDMIRRVLINLLENAAKFSPSEGIIHIGAHLEDSWVQIWVEDTGPGVPPERWKIIFDKYTRLHGKSGSGGFGLGLAYCRLAVEGHGGRIWIENATDTGARFSFTIPIHNPQNSVEA